MLNIGDIVRQDETIVNGRIEKDYNSRLSVVIMTANIDKEECVFTCPIINNHRGVKKQIIGYCHIPFMLVGTSRLDVVKIKDLEKYNRKNIHPVGINVGINNPSTINKICNEIYMYEAPQNKKVIYDFVKSKLEEKGEEYIYSEDEIKRLRRIKRKAKIRECKRGKV